MIDRLLHRVTLLVACAGATALAGCASTALETQWSDPQFKGTSLRGARVLVACEAADLAIKQVCEDRFSSELVARGGTPVVARELLNPTGDAYAPAARSTGASAALVVQVTQADVQRSSGFSLGLGGFGGTGAVGAGVGVAVPIGGGRTSVGYAANGRLLQATSGKLMWTGRATAPASNNIDDQLGDLSKAVLSGAEKAGFF